MATARAVGRRVSAKFELAILRARSGSAYFRSANPLERVIREIGSRADVVGIFPTDTSAIRLAGTLLSEHETTNGWLTTTTSRSHRSRSLSTTNPTAPRR